jgi:hypothetical protein
MEVEGSTMWRISIAVCLALSVAACGSHRLSLEEFAAQSEMLITDLNLRIDTLDSEWESQAPAPEGARTYWDGRLEARADFLEGLQALSPPRDQDDLFEEVLDLVERFTAAEEALAARVATFETIDEHWTFWDNPEGQAALALNAEVVAVCHVAQGQIDATQRMSAFSELAWMPSDVREVVEVVLGCR